MLEAAREELQTDERLPDAARSFDEIDVIRHQTARAEVDQVDAADHPIGAAAIDDDRR